MYDDIDLSILLVDRNRALHELHRSNIDKTGLIGKNPVETAGLDQLGMRYRPHQRVLEDTFRSTFPFFYHLPPYMIMCF